MSLTVEQILNECREDAPQTFELEKGASASTSTDIKSGEVEEMISLLKEASVPETTTVEQLPQIESNIYEKVAEAVILNSVLETIDEEGVKLAGFREKALEDGYSPKEVEAFIEKRAKASALKKMLSSKGAKAALLGAGGLGLAGGAGATGYKAGKDKERETTKAVGKAAFTAGRQYQYSRMRSLAERRQRLREYLRKRLMQQQQQGK